MKILVAIANFGIKNNVFLNILIKEYTSMSYNVDIVVLSNIPKDIGSDVEVIVGLPIKNPWSLPYGHKKIFADRLNDYDLFIYSEDDTLIKEKNISAFLEVTKFLPENKIAGFLRYEIDNNGNKYYSTAIGNYHWDPKSVESFDKYTFAYFTNEHSAAYILTKKQLKKAIGSGGFLIGPRQGVYDMLVTAATDPYTQCGFKKIICISNIDDFILHHLANKYFNYTDERGGANSIFFEFQIKSLLNLINEEKNSGELFFTRTKLNNIGWAKNYYEPVNRNIIDNIPKDVQKILSIGSGSGSTEIELVNKGFDVTAIPLDITISKYAEFRGVKLLSSDFNITFEIKNNKFDCLIYYNVLQYIEKPESLLVKFDKLLHPNGYVIVTVPNFNNISFLKMRFSLNKEYQEVKYIGCFDKTGFHSTTKKKLNKWLYESDLKVIKYKKDYRTKFYKINKITFNIFNKILYDNLTIISRKNNE